MPARTKIVLTLTHRNDRRSVDQPIKHYTKQHERFSILLRELCGRYCENIVRFYEFTQRAHLHVHALATIRADYDPKDVVVYMNAQARSYGYCDIALVKNEAQWVTYMTKEYEVNKRRFRELGLTFGVKHVYVPALKYTRIQSPVNEINSGLLDYLRVETPPEPTTSQAPLFPFN